MKKKVHPSKTKFSEFLSERYEIFRSNNFFRVSNWISRILILYSGRSGGREKGENMILGEVDL